ncbi:MAG: hypothetical protein K8F90_18525, partial [Hyphomicrobiales bacterium]|nr:hypothetical protein [Hyphomicrobiales bacterium]
MTGGDAVVEVLRELGVSAVFGVISIHNIPIYDAIQRSEIIHPVCVRHEQAAVSMADGYARSTGKLGVAITSTGPGAGNAMGAMVEAFTAGSPVLHLTGQIESHLVGMQKGYIHEMLDQTSMLQASCKWLGTPSTAADIPHILKKAACIAMTGRQRPVVVQIPIDLQYESLGGGISEFRWDFALHPSVGDMNAALREIHAARRILIWSGGGTISSNAHYEVKKLAEKLGAGVITSIGGRGVIAEDHDLSLGALALEQPICELLKQADLLIAIGTRFQGAATRGWQLQIPDKLIHIDIDSSEIGRNFKPMLGLIGDARTIILEILKGLEACDQRKIDANWLEQIVRAKYQSRQNLEARLGPWREVLEQFRDSIRPDDIV